MATFPGTQVATGVGTFLLLPDGKQLSFGNILLFERSTADIVFTLSAGSYTYSAPTELYAQKVIVALRSIPSLPASFYVITSIIPTFAILSISPDTGGVAGGTAITVTGLGFVDGCVANLGGKAATVAFVSETELTVTSPAGDAGIVTLTVINPNGSQTILPDSFTYT